MFKIAPSQEPVVEALQSGRALGSARALTRIDTHMSHVFLARDRAYKLKRAVRMPFVDFTTVELRRAACESELEVNRRFAPSLYLDVRPLIRGSGGAVILGGDGEVLDWVVVMRRFADTALFDGMAARGSLSPALVSEAAEKLACVHAAAPPTGGGGPQGYFDIVSGLRRTVADGAAAHGLESGSAALYDVLALEIGRRAALIEQRRRDGRVRRGHGDLHLRNICLFEGRATPFDALEFDPALATTDVIYDLAFLLMDLRRRDLRVHGNAAMNSWWNASGEAESGLALLPLFMALRAGVRAAVAMEAGAAAEAQDYRRLGLELLAPTPPRLVAIGGLSGSGKSAVARALAAELGGACGARLLRTDVIRRAGPDSPDADAYRPEHRAEVYRRLAERAAEAFAAGCPVIADATFQDAEARRAMMALRPGHALWLRAERKTRLVRVAARTGDASDATVAVAAAQTEPALEPGWTVVDAEGPLGDVVARARAVLGLE